jgi:hypothetical protein
LKQDLIYSGYQSNWNAVRDLNETIKRIGPTLNTLTFVGSYRYGHEAGNLPLDIREGGADAADIQVGTFTDGSTDHVFFVNRKTFPDPVAGTYEAARRTLEISFGSARASFCPLDVTTQRPLGMGAGDGFLLTLEPGEGKLVSLADCQ